MISHHPEMIDYMAETNGIWMNRLNSGESIIVDSPKIDINPDLLSYSEMIFRRIIDEIE